MSSFTVMTSAVFTAWILGAAYRAPFHRRMRTVRRWSLIAAVGSLAWAIAWVAAATYGKPAPFDYGAQDIAVVAAIFGGIFIITMVVDPPKRGNRSVGRPVQ